MTHRGNEYLIQVSLLSESAFFSAMLTGSYRESESGVIAIHDDAPCLSLCRVVKWLHTGEIRITDVYDALEIAETARFLSIDGVEDACLSWVRCHVGPSTCLRAWTSASLLAWPELAQIALPSIGSSLCALAQTPAFLGLTIAELLAVLEQDKLPVHTEEVVCDAAMQWVRHGRAAFLVEVLSVVRIALLPDAYVYALLADELVLADNGAMRVLAEAKAKATGHAQRRAYSLAGTIVLIGSDVDEFGVHRNRLSLWDPRSTDRRTYELPPRQGIMGSESQLACVANTVYVVGGPGHRIPMRSYDARERRWSDQPLYRSDVPDYRSEFALVSTATAIYVLGGTDAEGDAVADANMYDIQRRKWADLPDMATKRSDAFAAFVGGKVVVFGGENGGGLLDSVEEYDQASGLWNCLPPMPVKRLKASAVAIDGRVYVVGGVVCGWESPSSCGTHDPDRADAYDYDAAMWSRLPDMPPGPLAMGPSAMEVDGRLVVLTGHADNSLLRYEDGAWTARAGPAGEWRYAAASIGV